MQEIIELFKKHNINHAVMNFTCGGDSMGDVNFEYITKDGQEIPQNIADELTSFFENEVYNHVDFYVDSDGHYQGEFGTVEITLEEDCSEPRFEYSKSSSSEYSESITSDADIVLKEGWEQFINDNVLNINGGNDSITTNYKRDFIMTDEMEDIVEEIEEAVAEAARDHRPPDDQLEGELDSWYTFTTNEDGEGIKIRDHRLIIHVRNQVTVIKAG